MQTKKVTNREEQLLFQILTCITIYDATRKSDKLLITKEYSRSKITLFFDQNGAELMSVTNHAPQGFEKTSPSMTTDDSWPLTSYSRIDV